MNTYLQSLLEYIQKEKITFREEGDQPCLDSIWWHYGECYNLDSPAAKEGFRNLRERLDTLAVEESDAVITEVGCLCAEYERIAFAAGLRLCTAYAGVNTNIADKTMLLTTVYCYMPIGG